MLPRRRGAAVGAGNIANYSAKADAKADVIALITTNSEKARSWIKFALKNMGDTSGVGDATVFVKKTVGKTDYWVGKSDPFRLEQYPIRMARRAPNGPCQF